MKNEVIKEEKIDLGVISVEYREREEKDLRERGYFEPIQVKKVYKNIVRLSRK